MDAAQVRAELAAMKQAGMRVPRAAMQMAQTDADIAEYEGMSVGEVADLLIELADIA